MPMKHLKRVLAIAGIVGGLGAVAFALFLYFGVYNVSALEQHTAPVYRLLQFAMVRSMAARSDTEVPDLQTLDWQNNGIYLYEEHCQQCHGAPGVGPESFSLGMVPAPTAVASIARKRKPAEIFWVTRHGIKMSGMPAWRYRLTDQQIWQVVAFVNQIPDLTVSEYLALRNQLDVDTDQLEANAAELHEISRDTDLVERGRTALQQYNCSSCHRIPGVVSAQNDVGPPLGDITRRSFIAGILKYSDENLIGWIRFPSEVDPKSAMPNLGVTETHAREMVAYFRSLQEDE